jgi:hypothetical protein
MSTDMFMHVLTGLFGIIGLIFGAYKTGIVAGKNGTATRLEELSRQFSVLSNLVEDRLQSISDRLDKHIEKV